LCCVQTAKTVETPTKKKKIGVARGPVSRSVKGVADAGSARTQRLAAAIRQQHSPSAGWHASSSLHTQRGKPSTVNGLASGVLKGASGGPGQSDTGGHSRMHPSSGQRPPGQKTRADGQRAGGSRTGIYNSGSTRGGTRARSSATSNWQKHQQQLLSAVLALAPSPKLKYFPPANVQEAPDAPLSIVPFGINQIHGDALKSSRHGIHPGFARSLKLLNGTYQPPGLGHGTALSGPPIIGPPKYLGFGVLT
jgi:hypothetical protein